MNPTINEFRNEVLSLVNELETDHTTLEGSVRQRAANILAAKYPTRSKASIYQLVCYYVRRDSANKCDTRRVYTLEELHNLYLMGIAERKAYAEHSGKSYRALYEAISRYHRREVQLFKDSSLPELECTAEAIHEQGFFNFADLTHLSIHQLDHERLAEAKDLLRVKYGLSLRAPNILYHKPSGRRYYMKAQEQVALIANTVKYLAFAADQIKNGWQIVGDKLDPIADSRPNPTYLSVRKSRGTSKDVDFILSTTPKIIEALENLEGSNYPLSGTPVFGALERLWIKLNKPLDKQTRQ